MSERCDTFARLHQRGAPLFLPNAWDYASAAALIEAGYGAIGTTSLGVAAAAGKPDAVGATREETLALTRRLGRLQVLLTVDIEYGFSDDPDEVSGVAHELCNLGAVGINLEDGRPDATLSAIELHCAKIAAVKSQTPELFVNARTDAFWLAPAHAPPPIGEALRRSSAYIAAGADGIYIPGAADAGIVATLSNQIAAPLNVLYTPGEHTFADLAKAGAGRVSTGSLLIRATWQTIVQTARAAWTDAVTADPGRPSYAHIRAVLAHDR